MNPVRSKKLKFFADSLKTNRTSNGMKKKQFISLVASIIFVTALLPVSRARAQTGLLDFGGIVSYTTACTCSGTSWIWFTPLYLGGPVVITGAVVYSPYKTILYGYFLIGVPKLWHAGDYIPGVQACYVYAGKTCVVLPAVGLMSKVGTNRFK